MCNINKENVHPSMNSNEEKTCIKNMGVTAQFLKKLKGQDSKIYY